MAWYHDDHPRDDGPNLPAAEDSCHLSRSAGTVCVGAGLCALIYSVKNYIELLFINVKEIFRENKQIVTGPGPSSHLDWTAMHMRCFAASAA